MGKMILVGVTGVTGIVALVAAVLIAIAAQGDGPEPDHTRYTGLEAEAGTVHQSPDTHPDPDADIIAAQLGLTVAKAKELLSWQDEFGKYVGNVRSQYGDQVAAVWSDPAPGETGPGTRGYIRFTGAVPSGIATMEGVTLTGNGGLSEAEQYRRGELAAEALVALGYLSFLTGYDGSALRVEVQVAPGATPVTRSQIVTKLEELLKAEGLDGRAAQVEMDDLDLVITEGTGPFITLEHSRGPEPDHTRDTGLEAEAGTVHQSPDTHPDPDADIIAAQLGLTVAKAKELLAWQDEWGKYAANVRSQYGDQISAIWADVAPGETGPSTRGFIQFTGEVPSGLDTMTNVTLLGDGGISMADHKRRGELAADALVALGYLSFVTYYDRADKVLRAEVKVAPGATPVTKSQIVTKLQELVGVEGLQGRAAQVGLADLDLVIREGTGAFIKNEHSRGGN